MTYRARKLLYATTYSVNAVTLCVQKSANCLISLLVAILNRVLIKLVILPAICFPSEWGIPRNKSSTVDLVIIWVHFLKRHITKATLYAPPLKSIN